MRLRHFDAFPFFFFFQQGFKNLTEDLMKSGHEVIITRAEPKIVSILIGINPKIHVHAGGTDLSRFIHGNLISICTRNFR